jgi:hypothetical protein
MGAFITFLFSFERAILIGSSLKTLEHRALLERSTSFDPGHKIKTNMFPYSPLFQFIYRVELWANQMG